MIDYALVCEISSCRRERVMHQHESCAKCMRDVSGLLLLNSNWNSQPKLNLHCTRKLGGAGIWCKLELTYITAIGNCYFCIYLL